MRRVVDAIRRLTQATRKRSAGEPQTELRDHAFFYEESTSGVLYGYCPECQRYENDCLPNEFHGPIECRPWRTNRPGSPA